MRTVVVHRDQRPIRNHASNAHCIRVLAGRSRAGDQILNRRSVEQLDVGELEHLAQQRRREQRSVLDSDPVAVVLVRNAQLVEEQVRRLAHDHGAEELAAQPRAATGRNARFDDGDLKVWARGSERVGGAEAAGPGADDDDVGLELIVEEECKGEREEKAR